ncbi:cytochrome P450 [Coniella lustricola]|uniref:Cytochrome P450 n=1 Tax=Coniella lustricola TaxID=2025994 RepID=A0A2T3AA32_9PEZI|nr:cytochrome P450 [Coniella lustricola]
MISMGYKTAGGKPFEIPGPDHDHVFISSDKHLEEVRKAARDELSMFGATKQMFQPQYTMLGHNWLDERGAEGVGYIRACGTLFTRQLFNLMPDIERLVDEEFRRVTQQPEYTSGSVKIVQGYDLLRRIICTVNGFCFFGDELANNEKFMSKIFTYNQVVIQAAEVLRLLPEFMKSIVGPIVSRTSEIQSFIFETLNEVVARRMEDRRLRETGEISAPAPSDMIEWIIETAPTHLGWTSRRVTYEIIAIWFGSVHALSATATYALFDLCEHPEYIEPLRKEVTGPAYDEFIATTKGLPLLDSFIKESSRLSPIESMAGRRQALKDFVFSDGTTVKKGDWTCVPTKAMQYDDAYFPSADSFEGFRFAPQDKVPRDSPSTVLQSEPSRYSDISDNYYVWGIGGIVCPGRFYASIATKSVLAYILKNFDCSLENQNTPRTFTWRSYSFPRQDARVKFTAR